MEGWMEIGREWMDVLLCGLNWFGRMGGLQWVGKILSGKGWDAISYCKWMDEV
jgi:hypothetical protein